MADYSFELNRAVMDRIRSALHKSLSQTADEILSRERNDAVMPFRTGNLQNDSTYVDDSRASDGEADIVTDAPYARRLYYNPQYDFRRDHNANAQGEWWEPWLSGRRKADPQRIFTQFLQRNGGGVIK